VERVPKDSRSFMGRKGYLIRHANRDDRSKSLSSP